MEIVKMTAEELVCFKLRGTYFCFRYTTVETLRKTNTGFIKSAHVTAQER